MSDESHTTDVIDGIIAAINATLPSYRAIDGYISIEALDGGTLKREPVAMVFNPSLASETIAYQQRSQTWTYRLILVRAPNELRDPSEGLQLRADTQALITAINSDTTLDALTDDIKVSLTDLHEEGATHTISDMFVEDVTVTN
jgi:hypothetical protein